MSQKLGNIKIVLTNSHFQDKEIDKADLTNENNYYALLNKKRKRNSSHKNNKFEIDRCPSCASELLRKKYNHIHCNKIGNKNKNVENRDNNGNMNFINKNENSKIPKNKIENNTFMEKSFPKFNEKKKFFFNNEDNSNQETYQKNFNVSQDYKNEEEIIKFNENDNNEMFNEDKIKEKNYNKNENINNVINDNNNKINVSEETGKNIINYNSSIFRNEKYPISEGINQNIKLSIKVENKAQILAGNMLKKSNEKIDIMNEPKKSSQIILKVQKMVAPEIKYK